MTKKANQKIIYSKLKKLSLLVAVAFLLAQICSAQKTNEVIEFVDIQGNRRLTDKEIFVHIRTRPSQRLNKENLEEDIKKLHSLKWFDSASIRVISEPGRNGGVNIIFEVRELPTLKEVSFEGLKYFTQEQIKAELQQQKLDVNNGDILNLNKLQKVHLAIQKFLNERGFVDAKVSITEEQVDAASLKITFAIEEQPE